jgi:hypothetical protein
MVDQNAIYQNIIDILDQNHAEYKLFHHRPALTYEDLALAQKDAGFIGTEGKCLVLKADDNFIVYVTVQGRKVNFDQIKGSLNIKKISLALPQDLMANFGAKPGCAYPFGFDSKYKIFVNPAIYDQEWFLFSPLFPDKTIQITGSSLKTVFQQLSNSVTETKDFNI